MFIDILNKLHFLKNKYPNVSLKINKLNSSTKFNCYLGYALDKRVKLFSTFIFFLYQTFVNFLKWKRGEWLWWIDPDDILSILLLQVMTFTAVLKKLITWGVFTLMCSFSYKCTNGLPGGVLIFFLNCFFINRFLMNFR